MEIFILGIFLFLVTVYLLYIKKLDFFTALIFTISIFSLLLCRLNVYLGFFVFMFVFSALPFKKFFVEKDDEDYHDSDYSYDYDDSEEYNELNYIKFKNFINDYILLMKQDYNISGLVIYEEHDEFYKLFKLDSVDNFEYVKNIIEKDDGIFTLLKQFNNPVFKIDDLVISKTVKIKNEESDLKVHVYLYEKYLIYILYSQEIVFEELISKINGFLYVLKDLKRQIVLRDFRRELLAMSEGFNKVIKPNEVLSVFIENLVKFPTFDTLIFTEALDDNQVVKLVLTKDYDFYEYMNLEKDKIAVLYEDKNSLKKIKIDKDPYLKVKNKKSIINLAFEANIPLPVGYKFDYTTNILLEEEKYFKDYKSLLVYPVQEQKKPVGTIVLLSKEEGVYNKEVVKDLGLMFNLFDIAFLNAKIFKKMEQMATQDGLTGLVNHRTFQEKLNEYLARAKRENKKIAVILSDIDHFKSVNDTYGHPMGDEVLRQVAMVLKREIREVDLVARYGGEEFVIIADNIDKEEVYKLANRIREEIKKLKFKLDDKEFRVSISMGFSIFPDITTDKQKLIDFSDKALYHSKRNGRDRVTCICDISE